MTKKTIIALSILMVSLLWVYPVQANLPSKIDRKIEKYLKRHFMVKSIDKTPILVDADKVHLLDFESYNNQLYDIKVSNESKGFIIIDKARSRYDEFTFMVFLSYDLKIQMVRVLDYNEIHGVEIANKGWLSQFVGMDPESKIKYQENVDAISGATISSRSITAAIAEVLKKVSKLKKAQIL